jgi:hypothetical protein
MIREPEELALEAEEMTKELEKKFSWKEDLPGPGLESGYKIKSLDLLDLAEELDEKLTAICSREF